MHNQFKHRTMIPYHRYLQAGITCLCLMACFYSCKQDQGKSGKAKEEADTAGVNSKRYEQVINEKKAIFYGIYTPVEMSKLFEQYHIEYVPEILNPLDNADRYSSSAQLALNIGSYGVDLSYIRMFSKPQESIKYYMAVSRLSKELGLPEEYIRSPMLEYEKNLNNPEKLVEIATTTYIATEDYLRQNDRAYVAGLILVGGWVEALYIATHGILNEQNPESEIIQRIAAQKYSLNKLIALLETYAYEPSVSYYLHMMNVLKKYFDQFGMYYEEGQVELDTANDMIYAEKSYIDIPPNIIGEIKRVIAGIRAEVIS
jgi:hypothetical protein